MFVDPLTGDIELYNMCVFWDISILLAAVNVLFSAEWRYESFVLGGKPILNLGCCLSKLRIRLLKEGKILKKDSLKC